MTTLPLRLIEGHLFFELPDGLWLVDTGAGHSLGPVGGTVSLCGLTVPVQPRYLGATLGSIQKLVGVPFTGLIGQDLLLQLNIVFDLPAGTATISALPGLQVRGDTIELQAGTLGIPTLRVESAGGTQTWWLDTGAKLSYYQSNEVLAQCEPAGHRWDFFPLLGKFKVKVYQLPVRFGRRWESLVAGCLPWPLRHLLGSRAAGIVGVDLFRHRQTGFFPRQHELIVGERTDT